MVENNVMKCNDDDSEIEILQDFADKITYRIIRSIIQSPKTVSQICTENKLPLSSTYKKIEKLYNEGLITVERINIDSKGKKVLLYRSKIKSVVLNLKCDMISLQFDKNDYSPTRSIL